MFSISDKVICIDDSPANKGNSFPGGYVVKGDIYCVLGISGVDGLQIVGKPVIHKSGLEVGWRFSRFRKVNKTGTTTATAKQESAY